ncbi:hypothetical protein J6590_073159 [Homalodisca vitripennis]|nr:hypothetical protein J6590_073159 [Homalodisca vitripennis]
MQAGSLQERYRLRCDRGEVHTPGDRGAQHVPALSRKDIASDVTEVKFTHQVTVVPNTCRTGQMQVPALSRKDIASDVTEVKFTHQVTVVPNTCRTGQMQAGSLQERYRLRCDRGEVHTPGDRGAQHVPALSRKDIASDVTEVKCTHQVTVVPNTCRTGQMQVPALSRKDIASDVTEVKFTQVTVVPNTCRTGQMQAGSLQERYRLRCDRGEVHTPGDRGAQHVPALSRKDIASDVTEVKFTHQVTVVPNTCRTGQMQAGSLQERYRLRCDRGEVHTPGDRGAQHVPALSRKDIASDVTEVKFTHQVTVVPNTCRTGQMQAGSLRRYRLRCDRGEVHTPGAVVPNTCRRADAGVYRCRPALSRKDIASDVTEVKCTHQVTVVPNTCRTGQMQVLDNCTTVEHKAGSLQERYRLRCDRGEVHTPGRDRCRCVDNCTTVEHKAGSLQEDIASDVTEDGTDAVCELYNCGTKAGSLRKISPQICRCVDNCTTVEHKAGSLQERYRLRCDRGEVHTPGRDRCRCVDNCTTVEHKAGSLQERYRLRCDRGEVHTPGRDRCRCVDNCTTVEHKAGSPQSAITGVREVRN